jgi:large subunit ribosomal protein L30
MADLKITLVRSTIGSIPNHKKVVEALGLRKLQSSVRQKDNPAIRGMIQKVRHLVKVEEWTEEVEA